MTLFFSGVAIKYPGRFRLKKQEPNDNKIIPHRIRALPSLFMPAIITPFAINLFYRRPGNLMRRGFTRIITAPVFCIFILIPGAVKRFFIDFLRIFRQNVFTFSGNALLFLYGMIFPFSRHLLILDATLLALKLQIILIVNNGDKRDYLLIHLVG